MEGLVRPLTARSRFALRAALLVAWASGVGGAATSCWTLGYYRNPIPIRASATSGTAPQAARSGQGTSEHGEPNATAVAVSASASVTPDGPTATGSTEPSTVVFAPASGTGPAVAGSLDVPASAPPPQAPAPAPTGGAVQAPAGADQVSSGGSSISPQAELVIDVLEKYRRTRLPLAIADLLLSIALVIGVARTLGRWVGGKAWLQQVCIAVLLYGAVEHAITRDERRDFAEGMLDFEIQKLPPAKRPSPDERLRLLGLWIQSTRIGLLLELALFGGLAYALSRPSVILELAPRDMGGPRSSEDDEE